MRVRVMAQPVTEVTYGRGGHATQRESIGQELGSRCSYCEPPGDHMQSMYHGGTPHVKAAALNMGLRPDVLSNVSTTRTWSAGV